MVRYTLKQLSYFVAAAEGGSVAEAARSLNVAQPSVSSAISKLEDLFGVQLFLRRHAQGVTLTSAGQRLLADARGLLAQADDLAARAQGLGQSLKGRLDVGCFVTLTPRYLPGLVAGFRVAYPEVDLRLREGNQEDLLQGLATGRFDAAVLYDVDLGSDLTLQPLIEQPPYAVLPLDHPLAKHEKVSLRDLAAEPMILLDVPPSREYFTALFQRIGMTPKIHFHSPSFETVRGMVGNGMGFSLLVTRPASDLTYDGRRIVYRPLAEETTPGRIVLAQPAQSRPTRLIETFAKFCKDYFAES